MCKHSHSHTLTNAYTHSHSYKKQQLTCAHLCMHTNTHTHACTHTHTHTHTHTFRHTLIQSLYPLESFTFQNVLSNKLKKSQSDIDITCFGLKNALSVLILTLETKLVGFCVVHRITRCALWLLASVRPR